MPGYSLRTLANTMDNKKQLSPIEIKVKNRIKDAVERISEEYRLFRGFLSRVRIKNDNSYPTMAVDRNKIIYYNNDFVNSMDDDELRFVIVHEILHIVHKHVDKLSKIDPKEAMKHNVAMDLEINSTLKEIIKYKVSSKLYEKILFPDKYGLPELQSYSWYLDHLPIATPSVTDMVDSQKMENQKNKSSDDKEGIGNVGNSDQESDNGPDGKNISNSNSKTESDQNNEDNNGSGGNGDSENDKQNSNAKSNGGSGNSKGENDEGESDNNSNEIEGDGDGEGSSNGSNGGGSVKGLNEKPKLSRSKINKDGSSDGIDKNGDQDSSEVSDSEDAESSDNNGSDSESKDNKGSFEKVSKDESDEDTSDGEIEDKSNDPDPELENESDKILDYVDKHKKEVNNNNTGSKEEGRSGQGFGYGYSIQDSIPTGNYSYNGLFKLLVSITKKNAPRKDDYSYSRINRRFQGMDSEILRPGKLGVKKDDLKYAIIYDVSPSTDWYLNDMSVGLDEFYQKYKNKFNLDIDIYFTATGFIKMVPIKRYNKHEVPHGSGTYMYSGLEAVVKSGIKYHDILVITDGEDNSFSRFKEFNKKVKVAVVNGTCMDYVTEAAKSDPNLTPIRLNI